MKKASTTLQHYRATKRFIKTYQLEFLFSIAVAFYCMDLFMNHGADWGAGLLASCFIIVLALFISWTKPNLYLDEDFYNDVEELGEYE